MAAPAPSLRTPLALVIIPCIIYLILLYATVTKADGTASYNEHCDVGVTPDNKTILDTCDRTRNLICRQSRCVCQDEANQIWTARIVPKSRNRRSPGHGVGKAVLAGGVAGVAGGVVGYELASHASSSGNSGSSSSSGGGSSDSGNIGKHNELYYACHSRVGGQCVLDAYSNTPIIITINKPSTTTDNPNNQFHHDSGSNNITVASITSQLSYDLSQFTVPKCVQYADCKPASVKIVNGTVVSPVSNDPRLGECMCQGGYKDNNIDICVKVVNSAGKVEGLSAKIYVTLATLYCVSTLVL